MRLDAIVIVPYDPAWPTQFLVQRNMIDDALGSWLERPVEHMGSTAVPGLQAKPIIDMLAIVGDIDAKPDAVARMESIGWVHAPEPFDEAERRASFCFPTEEHRTHHLHVVEASFPDWPKWLAFRDYLSTTPTSQPRTPSSRRGSHRTTVMTPTTGGRTASEKPTSASQ